MPEWYLLIGLLAVLTLLGVLWAPLLRLWPLLALAVALPVAQATFSAARARFTSEPDSLIERVQLYGLTAVMHLLQPLARLIGRIRHGLTPWRERRGSIGPQNVASSIWREDWQDPQVTLASVLRDLRETGAIARAGEDFDDWDIEVRGGLLAGARLRMGVEEHGAGRQLLRFRLRPQWSLLGAVLTAGALGIGLTAAADGAWAVGLMMLTATGLLSYSAFRQWRFASGSVNAVINHLGAGA